MKNSICFFTLLLTLLFTSCTKETITIPETETIGTIAERSTTIEIEVSEISNSEVGNEFLVDFQANYDFSETVLESTQYLKLVDANGDESTLTFQVNSFTGSNGALNVNFSIGTNNLNGLALMGVQEIIIEEEVIN